jgi:hypothetical protein
VYACVCTVFLCTEDEVDCLATQHLLPTFYS